MIPPPPRSSLFPFTTLFRSRLGPSRAGARRGPGAGHHAARGGLRRRHRTESREDRKSTRLNSSHLVISYAVFCLKKKKRMKRQIRSDPKQLERVRREAVAVV